MSTYNFRSINMQKQNSCQTSFQHKYNKEYSIYIKCLSKLGINIKSKAHGLGWKLKKILNNKYFHVKNFKKNTIFN